MERVWCQRRVREVAVLTGDVSIARCKPHWYSWDADPPAPGLLIVGRYFDRMGAAHECALQVCEYGCCVSMAGHPSFAGPMPPPDRWRPRDD
jgi:hypothetical protein